MMLGKKKNISFYKMGAHFPKSIISLSNKIIIFIFMDKSCKILHSLSHSYGILSTTERLNETAKDPNYIYSLEALI